MHRHCTDGNSAADTLTTPMRPPIGLVLYDPYQSLPLFCLTSDLITSPFPLPFLFLLPFPILFLILPRLSFLFSLDSLDSLSHPPSPLVAPRLCRSEFFDSSDPIHFVTGSPSDRTYEAADDSRPWLTPFLATISSKQ